MTRPVRPLAKTAAAVLLGVASVGLVLSWGSPTTYAAVSDTARVATVLAGVVLTAGGCLLVWTSRRNSCGPVLLALAAAWWAPAWVGWDAGPPWVRSIALVAVPFLVPLLAHLAAGLPDGRLASPAARGWVWAAYGVTATYALVRAAVRDPWLDPTCWSNCTDNVLLVSAQPAFAPAWDRGWWAVSGAIALAALGVAIGRLAGTTSAGRRARWPVLLPAATGSLAVGVQSALLLAGPPEDPSITQYAVVYVVLAAALTLLGLGACWLVAEQHQRIRMLEDLSATDLAGDDLVRTLADGMADPTVRVAFWLPPHGWADRDGSLVDPDPESAHVDIARDGVEVARVWHDPALRGAADLVARVSPAAALAVDNERLRALLLVQLRELRESRRRVVAAADAARRALERDLHDGAQQRLLALALELRIARDDAAARGDDVRADRCHRAYEKSTSILEEVRGLARGIYPAVLDNAGLAAALRSLAQSAPLTLTIDASLPCEVPPVVARATYLAAHDAVHAAGAAGGARVQISVAGRSRRVILDVRPATIPLAPRVEDRVGAVGGSVRRYPDVLRVEVPCE
jgi:signal transduction histidine kinase